MKELQIQITIKGTETEIAKLTELERELISVSDGLKKYSGIVKEGGGAAKASAEKIVELTETQRRLKQEIAATKKEIDLKRLAQEKLGNSYNDLTQRNKLLSDELRKLQDPLGTNKKRFTELSTEINSNTENLKTMDAAMGRQFRNVGNYSDSIKGLFGNINIMGVSINDVSNKLSQISALLKTVTAITNTQTAAIKSQSATNIPATTITTTLTTATKAQSVATTAVTAATTIQTTATKANWVATTTATIASKAQALAQGAVTVATTASSAALRVFRTALIATGIGAVVAALGSLIAFLTQTETGSKKLSIALGFIKGLFETFKEIVLDVGAKLFAVFENPKQAALDLVDFIKTNLINRFKAFAVIVEGIANMDFKQILNGTAQLATGIENTIDKVADFGNKIGDAASKNSKLFAQLAADRDKLQDRENDFILTQAENNKKVSELRLAAVEKDKLSDAERAKLLNEAIKIEEGTILERIAIAKEKARIAVAELSVKKDATDEEIKIVNEAKAAAINAETEGNLAILAIRRTESSALKGDLEEKRKAAEEKIKIEKDKNDKLVEEQKKLFDEILLADTSEIVQANQKFEEKKKILEQHLKDTKVSEEDAKDAIKKLEKQHAVEVDKIIKETHEKRLEEERKFIADKAKELDKDLEKSINIEKQKFISGTINKEQLNENVKALNKKRIEDELASLNLELNQSTASLSMKSAAELATIDEKNQAIIEEKKKLIQQLIDLGIIEKEEILQTEEDFEQQKMDIAVAAAQATADTINNILNFQSAQLSNKLKEDVNVINESEKEKLKILQERHKKGLISDEDFEKKKGEIEKKAEEQRDALQREAARKQKIIAISQAMIAGAMAIMNILASQYTMTIFDIPLKSILVAAQIAATALQLATINAQTFSRGGRVKGLFNAKDDVPALLSRGEVVLNPEQQARLGGVQAFRAAGVPGFQGGGIALPSRSIASPVQQKEFAFNSDLFAAKIGDRIAGVMQEQRVIVVESDITTSQRTIELIESEARL